MTVEPIEGTEPTTQSQEDRSQSDASDEPETIATNEPETAAGHQPDTAVGEQPAAEAASEEASTPAPSTEAAVGASGARPLGAADAVAASSDSAVEAIDGSRDPGGPAAEAVSSTDAPAAGADADAPAAAEVAAAEADAPAAAEADAPAAAEADAPAAAEADSPSGASEPSAAAEEGTEASSAAPSAEPEAGSEAPAADSAPDETSDFADAPPAESPDEAEPVPVVDDRPEPTTMEELLSEQTDEIRSLKHGDVVEGQVVRIDKDEILVDIGAKSEGVVSNRELYGRNAESQPELNIGDTVLVYVLQPESNEGHAVLSLRRAGLERKWRSMQEQLDAGVIIDAPVIDHNKGGLIVDCGIRGFVPISQIVDFPRRPQNEQPRDAAQEIAEKLQPYVGRKLRLKILEVNRKANRLILSEKVALYEERREKRDELFSSLTVGQKVTGSVRSIAPFGVFVDLGGIDGLVHKSELSWNKVNNPESGYKVGEEVEAEVIDINHERGRISLSIRRLQPDPWHSTVADLKVGDVIDGTVTKIVNFGSFVRVRDGLEGLIHISELSHQRVAHPGDVVHEGQNLKLKVISLDSERHRLGLSLKQAEEAPARPAPSEPRERRPRSSGPSYDPSQAVQEPEEGIDNTLAAAFAQVRQQMAESDAGDEPAPGEPASDEAAASGSPAEELGQAPEIDKAPVSQGSEASALEVGGAEATAAEPATAEPDAEATAPEPTADEPEGEATAAEPATAESDAEATAPEPTPDEPTADEPTADEPTADEPTADEPEGEATAAEPATAEPDAEATAPEPTADEPTADEPTADDTAADEPTADEPEGEATAAEPAPAEPDAEATAEPDADATAPEPTPDEPATEAQDPKISTDEPAEGPRS